MSDFPPPELLFDILLRLPPKDLVRCTCVSKGWYAFIRHQRFIKAHLQRSIATNSSRNILVGSSTPATPSRFFSLPFEDLTTTIRTAVEIAQPLKEPEDFTIVLGYSANGVVCIRNHYDGCIALWNPSIQKFKKISRNLTAEEKPLDLGTRRCYGFGYDSCNDDYKFVIFNSRINVYSVKSNAWKSIQQLPRDDSQFVMSGEMLFLNGGLSWLMQGRKYYRNYVILTLDLATEEYREFPAPVDGGANSKLGLEVLGGSLCIFVNHFGIRNDVWIMKEYGVTRSWTFVFSIDQRAVPSGFLYYQPLMLSNDGEMALLKQVCKHFNRLYWFDLRNKSFKQVEIRGLPREFNATITVGSLCLVDGDLVVIERQQQKKRKI